MGAATPSLFSVQYLFSYLLRKWRLYLHFCAFWRPSSSYMDRKVSMYTRVWMWACMLDLHYLSHSLSWVHALSPSTAYTVTANVPVLQIRCFAIWLIDMRKAWLPAAHHPSPRSFTCPTTSIICTAIEGWIIDIIILTLP